MGRRKLEIKKIETYANRKVTYAKRLNGLMRKAQELSVLCDVEIAVIAFSPAGKLTHFSKDDNVLEIFTRYVNAPQQEKAKGKFQDPSKIAQNLTGERGFESPRGCVEEDPREDYAALQLKAEELKSLLDKTVVERNISEQEAHLFSSDEFESPRGRVEVPREDYAALQLKAEEQNSLLDKTMVERNISEQEAHLISSAEFESPRERVEDPREDHAALQLKAEEQKSLLEKTVVERNISSHLFSSDEYSNSFHSPAEVRFEIQQGLKEIDERIEDWEALHNLHNTMDSDYLDLHNLHNTMDSDYMDFEFQLWSD